MLRRLAEPVGHPLKRRRAGAARQAWCTSWIALGCVLAVNACADASSGVSPTAPPVTSAPQAAADTARARHSHGRVTVTGSSPAIAEIARQADTAVTRLQQVWPQQWSGRVHVEIPATEAEFTGKTGGAPGRLTGVAATTVAELGAEGNASDIRIVLDPGVWAELSSQGRQIVLNHETVHVALLDRPRAPRPAWLVEGMAEYLAYRGSGLDVREVAQPLLMQVAQDGAPKRLPADEDFEGRYREQAYAQAWIACQVAAEIEGEDALLRALTRLRPAGPPDQAGEPLPLDTERLTRAWRAELQRLAHPSGSSG